MSNRLPDILVAAMHAEIRAGATLAQTACKYGRTAASLYSAFEVRGLPVKLTPEQRQAGRAKCGLRRRAKLDEVIAEMHADYAAGMSLHAVGLKYGRHRGSVRELFVKRGLPVRDGPNTYRGPRLPNGQIPAAQPLTSREIDALIKAATKIAVPVALKREWRTWSLARRSWFVDRLRWKLRPAHARPERPFSDNVVPFDYGTPEAWEIVERLNADLPSRTWRVKIDLCSQGVIWRGRLAFWSAEGTSPGVGAYYVGPWTREGGRPAVHRLIWEAHHGRPVPPRLVVFHADGNRNNFSPDNLELASKNDVCRRNQASALNRKSRALTAALLHRTQHQPNHDHARHPDAFTQLTRTIPGV